MISSVTKGGMRMFFPRPASLEMGSGYFSLPVSAAREDLLSFYKTIKGGIPGVRVFYATQLGREEYLLRIGADGVFLSVSCDEGLFRAAASLRQMLLQTSGSLPCLSIRDFPSLPHRGYMLDISRGKKPRPETLREIVDYLAALKYNEFQLYMEGDSFKYSAYPDKNADYDCLTPEDLHRLDQYCRERFISLVPNQNSFGHMYTWLRQPAFHPLGLFGSEDEVPSTLNPLLPESFAFMKNLYASLLPCFSSEYVNIGLDEAHGLGRYQTEACCREKGRSAVFMDWLNRLADHLREGWGKKVMFWSDMIHHNPQAFSQIPKDAVVLEWGYELIQSQRMTAYCIAWRDAGIRYYVCPATNVHSSFSGRMDVTTFNIRTCGELAAEYGAEGLLLTDWGNGGHAHPWIWSAHPIALAAQYAWNPGAPQDGESFKADFIREAEHFCDAWFFGGEKVSRLLGRMANYYLLEPERVHVCTMCAQELALPLSQTRFEHFFDLKDSGDDFCFDNVTAYVSRVLADIEKLSFDETLRREIRLTAELIITGSELCKIKLHPEASRKEAAALAERIDKILPVFAELWDLRNYEHGRERFMGWLTSRRLELLELAGGSSPQAGM